MTTIGGPASGSAQEQTDNKANTQRRPSLLPNNWPEPPSAPPQQTGR